MIAGTKEFFIAVVDHAEWSGSFTVWGQVCASSSLLCDFGLVHGRVACISSQTRSFTCTFLCTDGLAIHLWTCPHDRTSV